VALLQYGCDEFLDGGNERVEIGFGAEGAIFKIDEIIRVCGYDAWQLCSLEETYFCRG